MPCSPEETIQGVGSRLGFAESNFAAPPSAPVTEIEMDGHSFGLEVTQIDTSGINGTEAESFDRMAEIQRRSMGGFSCRPTALDLDEWLPRITGGTYAAPVAGLKPILMAETRPCWDAFARDSDGKLRVYRENRVMSATFSASEAQALSLQINAVGTDRDSPIITGYTWPALVKATAGKSFLFPQLQVVVAGTAYRIYRFSLAFNYAIDVQFMNSYTATAFPSAGRTIVLSVMFPWKQSTLFELLRTPQVVKLTLDFGTGAARRTLEWEGQKVIMGDGNKEPGVPGKGSINWDANLVFKYDRAATNGPNDQIVTRLRTAGDV